MRRWIILAALGAASSAGAQVGYEPARSPFVDLEYRQELSLIAGPYLAKKDPAGVAPGDGTFMGVRYAWRAGGPAHIVGSLGYVNSERHVIDVFKPEATRDLGARSWPLYTADVGLSLSLTGAKSYRRLVPVVGAGLGFVSDFKANADTGGFKFGTRFAFNWGGGVRWVPGGRWALRVDVTDRMYTIAYPDAYYTIHTPSGGNPVPAVLSNDVSKSRWTNNAAITLGVSYLFSR